MRAARSRNYSSHKVLHCAPRYRFSLVVATDFGSLYPLILPQTGAHSGRQAVCIKKVRKMSFKSLGLSDELVRAVTERGYTEATPIQAQAIPVILKGGDLMGGAQTGTGKTAGFTLPLLQRLMAKPVAGAPSSNFPPTGERANVKIILQIVRTSVRWCSHPRANSRLKWKKACACTENICRSNP